MSQVCDICDKKPSSGHSVSRLGKNALVRRVKSRTKRQFKPNIQLVRTVVNGTPVRVRACTSCLKKGKVLRRAA